MPERICPNCGETLTVNATAVPLRVRCPACKDSFTQRPVSQPSPRTPQSDSPGDAEAPPRWTFLPETWRGRMPSTHFLLAIAVIVGAIIAAHVAARRWRESRPGPTAEVPPTSEVSPPADQPIDTPPEPDLAQPAIPSRDALTMPDEPDAEPIYPTPPPPFDAPRTREPDQADRWTAATSTAARRQAVHAAASPHMARITATDAFGVLVGEGLALVVSADGLVLTNFQTVRQAVNAEVILPDGTRLAVTGVAATDPAGDLALLVTDGANLPHWPPAATTFPEKDATVYVTGLTGDQLTTAVATLVRLIKPNEHVVTMELSLPPGTLIAGAAVLTDDRTLIAIGSDYFSARLGAAVAVPADIEALLASRGETLTLTDAGVRLSVRQMQAIRAARTAMADGDNTRAGDILASLSHLADGKPAVWIARGDALVREDKLVEAADAYQRAVDLQSDDSADLYRRLGEVRAKLSRPILAIAAFRRAIEIDATSSASHFGLGDVYLAQREYSAAIAALTTAISLDAAQEIYHYSLGAAYYADEQYPQAAGAFRTALELGPTEPLNAYALGNCYYALGEYRRAKDAYQMAVNLAPDTPLYQYFLGNACHRLGDSAQAVRAYERFIALEPATTRSDQAREFIAELKDQPDQP